MADISRITLPSGNTYDIKDAVARQMISAGFAFQIAWTGDTTPNTSVIPDAVTVTYNGRNYTGELTVEAADHNVIYLVRSSTQAGVEDRYDEYVLAQYMGQATWEWEKLGDTQIDLSDVVTGVSLNKQTSNAVTGYASPTTANVIGTGATMTLVPPAYTANTNTTYVGASLGTTKKLDLESVSVVSTNSSVTIPNVTNKGTASTWSFVMGTGTESETLVISGANSTTPTLGTALTATNTTTTSKTFAKGTTSTSGTGVVVPDSVSVTSNTSSATGRVKVVTGVGTLTATSDGSVEWANKDSKTVLTGLGTASTATVLNNSTSISVTKGS